MMFVSSYSNTMRDAQPFPIYGIRRDWFPAPVPPASSKEIIARVAAWHGVSYSDVVGARRMRAMSAARRDAVAAIKAARPHLSSVQIGALINRDHTTVLHHMRKAGLR